MQEVKLSNPVSSNVGSSTPGAEGSADLFQPQKIDCVLSLEELLGVAKPVLREISLPLSIAARFSLGLLCFKTNTTGELIVCNPIAMECEYFQLPQGFSVEAIIDPLPNLLKLVVTQEGGKEAIEAFQRSFKGGCGGLDHKAAQAVVQARGGNNPQRGEHNNSKPRGPL